MGKTINLAVLLIVSFLLLATTTGRGEIITYQLPPAFEREYSYDDPYLQMDFDLGVTFTEISNVYIDWSGEITAGLAVHNDDPGGEPFTVDTGIYGSLGFNPSLRYTALWGGSANHPNPELFDLQSEFESSPGPTDWSDLLDGQGTITLGYTEPIMLFDTFVEHGLVVLNNGALVVDGVVVPEVSTLLLLGMGMIYLRVEKYKKARKR
jgi:hypothetical protein